MATVRTGAAAAWLTSLLQLREGEAPGLAGAFVYFFLLLCAYYILRPLRETMGVTAGVENIQWLFTGTFVVMLVAVPVFGAAASRWPRPQLVIGVYVFFIANILVFFGLFRALGESPWLARAFFVWISVFNLFVVSIFWSFMVDLFSREQARRLFGVIAAGGSAGAVSGPALTALLVERIGPTNLLPISAALLVGALACVVKLLRWAPRHGGTPGGGEVALGGSVWAGLRQVARSRYLQGVCALMFLYTLLTTVLYFQQANLVDAHIAEIASQTRYFATVDLAVNLLAIVTQVLVTGRLVVRYGLRLTLVIVPVLLTLAFGVLSGWNSLAVVAAAMVLVRAGTFSILKPGQEMLFTVVGREAKYKAKNFIDTVVYRGGDALSGWLFTAFTGLGLGLGGVAAVAAPFAVVWAVLARRLGQRCDTQRGLIAASADAEEGGDLAGDLRAK